MEVCTPLSYVGVFCNTPNILFLPSYITIIDLWKSFLQSTLVNCSVKLIGDSVLVSTYENYKYVYIYFLGIECVATT